MIVKCPICQSTEYGVLGTCRCGYNFTEDKIADKELLWSEFHEPYFSQLEKWGFVLGKELKV